MLGSATTTSGSMQALHRFQANRSELNGALIRLSTGQRINRGADDPAGLISSSQLQAALALLDAESRSLQRMNHVAGTADAALDEVSSLLNDNEGLAVQLANTGALGADEHAAIQSQIDANTQAINRITASASFNGQKLFDGSMSLTAGGETLALPNLSAAAINASDIASLRGEIGAFQSNSIASTLNANRAAFENLAEADSMIADTDYAGEIVTLTRYQILDEASLKAMGIINRTQDHLLDLLS